MVFCMSQMSSVTFVAVKWGQKYSADYVNILFDMISRNLPAQFSKKFVCFTEDAAGIDGDIEIRPLPGDLTGWWNKLYLFKDGVFEKNERIFFLDLDTVIVGPLIELASYDGSFAILRDFYRPNGLQSSIMLWRGGFAGYIWDSFLKEGKPQIKGGDQAWIERCRPQVDLLQDIFPGFFASYKEKSQLAPPKGAHVVCFHGDPKPHEVTDGWVSEVWRKKGHFSQPFGTLGDPLAHVRHSLTLPFPQLRQSAPAEASRPLCLVGNGGSRVQYLDHLRQAQQQDYEIWALDSSYSWLMEQGIKPHVHILASPEVSYANFVPEKTETLLLYASQCHPEVFLRASHASSKIVVWHASIDGIRALPDFGESVLIGGGTTAEILSIGLAFVIGARVLHLFGYDSSYDDNTAIDHEQDSVEMDQKIYIQVDDRRFVSTVRLAQQVNEFRMLLKTLMPQGLGIKMHGEGLLPYAMQQLLSQKKSA